MYSKNVGSDTRAGSESKGKLNADPNQTSRICHPAVPLICLVFIVYSPEPNLSLSHIYEYLISTPTSHGLCHHGVMNHDDPVTNLTVKSDIALVYSDITKGITKIEEGKREVIGISS